MKKSLQQLDTAAYMLYSSFMPLSGKKIIQILLKRGWFIESQRGSHIKLIKGHRMAIIPIHGNRDLGRGLIRAIEKQTGEKLL